MNADLKSRSTIKRRLATENECKNDLSRDLIPMFEAFSMACNNYEREVIQTPVGARARGFEASLLNSKMIQSIQSTFPNDCKFGKYKRFILRLEGYTVLFKKLDNKNMPMNIKTKYSLAITDQLAMSLFEETTTAVDPILFFGYRKDRFGNIIDPKLVYIDDNKVNWTITEKDIQTDIKIPQLEIDKIETVLPKLKISVKEKKAMNE